MVRGIAAAAATALTVSLLPGVASAASSWTLQPVPAPGGQGYNYLSAISCTSSADCLAAGLDYNARRPASAEFWNGSRWVRHGIPAGAPQPNVGGPGVSCTSAANCIFVANTGAAGGNNKPLAEYWNGSQWTNQHAKSPGFYGSENVAELSSISCVSATSCVAVGSDQTGGADNGDILLLAEYWNGSKWKLARTPNPGGGPFAAFNSVSCAGASDCTAVGYQQRSAGAPTRTLAEHWNGSTWTIEATPSLATAVSQLNAISCTSTSSCEAVGYHNSSKGSAALAEHWNGTSWAVQATPVQAGTTSSALNGISCISGSDCIAVGAFTSAGSTSGLAEQWNGTAWAEQSTAPSADNIDLAAVACLADGFCSAVGTDTTKNVPIAESENG